MANTNASKTKLQNIQAAEFRRKALELRKLGHSYFRIAEILKEEEGIVRTHQAVEKAVKKAISELTREPAEDVLAMELERLDELLLVSLQQARDGNLAAIDRVLRVMERRAKYLGIDHTPDGQEGHLSASELQAIMAEFSKFMPPEPGSNRGTPPDQEG